MIKFPLWKKNSCSSFRSWYLTKQNPPPPDSSAAGLAHSRFPSRRCQQYHSQFRVGEAARSVRESGVGPTSTRDLRDGESHEHRVKRVRKIPSSRAVLQNLLARASTSSVPGPVLAGAEPPEDARTAAAPPVRARGTPMAVFCQNCPACFRTYCASCPATALICLSALFLFLRSALSLPSTKPA
jgi:hypothetical protein